MHLVFSDAQPPSGYLYNHRTTLDSYDVEIERVLLLIEIFLAPIIVTVNFVVILTTLQIPQLHHQAEIMIAGLAFADFLVGAVTIPIYIIDDIAETWILFRKNKLGCGVRYIVPVMTEMSSLSMLTLLVLDRFISINWPFFYDRHACSTNAFIGIGLVFLVEAIKPIFMFNYFLAFNESTIDEESCTIFDTHTGIFMAISQGLQLAACLIMCSQVYFITMRTKSNIRKTLVPTPKWKVITKANITATATFLYIILWTPSLLIPVAYGTLHFNDAVVYDLITRHLRLLNSLLNFFIYAYSRKLYRIGLKHILTKPPCRWPQLLDVFRHHSYSSTLLVKKRKASQYMNYLDNSVNMVSQCTTELGSLVPESDHALEPRESDSWVQVVKTKVQSMSSMY